MQIQVSHLRTGSKEIEYTLSLIECPRIKKPIIFNSEGMKCYCKVKDQGSGIFVTGNFSVFVKTECDRCIKEIHFEVSGELDLTLMPEEEMKESDTDVEISLNDSDIDYYSKGTIDLNKIFEDQFLLEYPLSAVCSENCKGLCSECGMDLNQTVCECSKKPANNVFSVLKKLQE